MVLSGNRYYECSQQPGSHGSGKSPDALSLVLFLIGLQAVASVWLGFWLVYLFFVIRYFPRIQTPRLDH